MSSSFEPIVSLRYDSLRAPMRLVCSAKSKLSTATNWNALVDSLRQPYLDSDFQSRWFDFGGDTVIRADK